MKLYFCISSCFVFSRFQIIQQPYPDLKIFDNAVSNCTPFKLIGVTLREKLNIENHCGKDAFSIFQKIGFVKKCRNIYYVESISKKLILLSLFAPF